MVADLYTERIHAAGLQVLLHDHRGFGVSGGDNRQQINRWLQASGYRDAIEFLTRQPEVDPGRIAIWGDSLSGTVAMGVAAAASHRVAHTSRRCAGFCQCQGDALGALAGPTT